jgi:membrane-associated phospholipid phosphatase
MTGLFASDRYTSSWVKSNGELSEISKDVSNFGQAYVTVGVAGAFYVAGRLTHNPKARETGILSLESLVDTGIVTEVFKFAARRQRPNADEHFGEFIDGGTSFPSGHSSSVWSIATVIAYEYKDNPWIKYGAIAAATAVSLSRYTGRNHFLSDIAAGSAAGFLIGRYVFHEYHDPNVDNPKYKKTTTWMHPTFLPSYNSRSHSYGGSLVWHL